MNKSKHKCWDCACVIPLARVKFLTESGIKPERFTCVKHSNTTRIKGIYSGEVGTSPIIFCDKVFDDSVRTKFINPDENIEESDDDIDE